MVSLGYSLDFLDEEGLNPIQLNLYFSNLLSCLMLRTSIRSTLSQISPRLFITCLSRLSTSRCFILGLTNPSPEPGNYSHPIGNRTKSPYSILNLICCKDAGREHFFRYTFLINYLMQMINSSVLWSTFFVTTAKPILEQLSTFNSCYFLTDETPFVHWCPPCELKGILI